MLTFQTGIKGLRAADESAHDGRVALTLAAADADNETWEAQRAADALARQESEAASHDYWSWVTNGRGV